MFKSGDVVELNTEGKHYFDMPEDSEGLKFRVKLPSVIFCQLSMITDVEDQKGLPCCIPTKYLSLVEHGFHDASPDDIDEPVDELWDRN